MIGVLGHILHCRLFWAGDNLSECYKFCFESCPWRSINRCWPAVHRATTVLRMPPYVIMSQLHVQKGCRYCFTCKYYQMILIYFSGSDIQVTLVQTSSQMISGYPT